MYGGYDHPSSSMIPHSPSPEQGWGRVNLDDLLQEDVEISVYDEDHGANPSRRFTDAGDYWTVELEPDDNAEPIIAVMTFTDAASEPTESGSLVVNNLNMTIVKPGNPRNLKHYRANDFATDSWYSKKYSVNFHPAMLNDEHNNVKVIRIPAGEIASAFTLRVHAVGINDKAVPGMSGETENQDFALYVYNASPTP